MSNQVKAHVIAFASTGDMLSKIVASFSWQKYSNKTLHVINVGGSPLVVSPEAEDSPVDIRYWHSGGDEWVEHINDGLVFLFSESTLYMPWYIEQMVIGWMYCGKKAYTHPKMLYRFDGKPGLTIQSARTDEYNTVFQASHLQAAQGDVRLLWSRLEAENQIGAAAHSEVVAQLYGEACPEKYRKEGVQFRDYTESREMVENELHNLVCELDAAIPAGSHAEAVASLKAWVPRKLEIISVISDDQYHTWQAVTLAYSLRKYGYSKHLRILVYHQYSHPLPDFVLAMRNFPEVQVYYYKDANADMAAYKSVMRPHTLRKHFELFPHLKHAAVLYIDSDVIFTSDPHLHDLTTGPNCYTADTIGYIGAASYLTHPDMGEHGRELLEQMASVVGIDPDECIRRDHMSGGAQYILKDVGVEYWRKVEKDSAILHLCMQRLNRDLLNPSTPEWKRTKGETVHVQAWCADMWAVLWNLWLLGKNTPIVPNLCHSWATDPIAVLGNYPIHHNAGVTHNDYTQFRYFPKWMYVDKWPYDIDIHAFSEHVCSFAYAEAIKETFDWLKAQKKE